MAEDVEVDVLQCPIYAPILPVKSDGLQSKTDTKLIKAFKECWAGICGYL